MSIQERVGKNGISFLITVNRGYKIDKNGKYKKDRITSTFKPPKDVGIRVARKLAKEYEVEFERKVTHFQGVKETMKVHELCEWYFENYMVHMKRKSTQACERNVINKYIIAYLGNKRLSELNSPLITEFLSTVSEKRDKDGKSYKPKLFYSDAYVKLIYSKLHTVLEIACKQGWLKDNPSDNAIRPKRNIDYKKPPLELYQAQDLLDRTKEYHPKNALIRFLLNTGLRIGEALALSWYDIDFEDSTISINKAVTCVNGEVILGKPKTRNGFRTISMNNLTRETLLEHKEHQDVLIQNMRGRYNKRANLVFPREDGEHHHRSTISHYLQKLIKGSDYEYISLHSLRHACATLLLNNGVDLKVVSNHLGHHDIGITADIYCDVLLSQKKNVAKLLDFVLEKKPLE